mmetsp:Transcript_1879/g.6214  ORF Transcript_1879/g.6214 Transcript_1879/m.6214 type:complete len:218 (-) Transcript_1879:581-1234(-)
MDAAPSRSTAPSWPDTWSKGVMALATSVAETSTMTMGCSGMGSAPSRVSHGWRRRRLRVRRRSGRLVRRPLMMDLRPSDTLRSSWGCGTTSGQSRMACMMSMGVGSEKGGLPYAHMCSVTPTAHMSHASGSNPPSRSVSHISGAKKAGVPAVLVASPASVKSAVPKSPILSMLPSLLDTSRLSGLMSRWAMPFMCRYSRPTTRCLRWDQMRPSFSGT